MTTRRSWKRTESQVASRIGGERVPVTGRARGDAPDIAHDIWSPEVKHWTRMPVRVVDAMSQAKAAARNGQIPIVVLHQAGKRHDDDLVVVRLADFVDLYGEVGP